VFGNSEGWRREASRPIDTPIFPLYYKNCRN
jgi:hypothetical protein